ncbi:MAG: DNA-binding transcriptional regulator KdgR [Desulfovibrio sp.]|uniref:DNA-binding transcriptional regulator KdgR n=1 Tax=Desulfovibrio sp. 7SRBS1 TaxID=3378064 RepID=UPI003B40BC15
MAGEPVAAVLKAFNIIDMLASEGALGVSEIAKRLGTPKSGIHRLLQTLAEVDVVASDQESQKYFLTFKLLDVGSKAVENMGVVRVADEHMQRINDTTGETVHLGVLERNSIVYVHKIDSKYTLRMASRIGKSAPVYCTALGKVLTAWLPEAEREAIIQSMDYKALTPHTITSAEAFRERLNTVRTNGYAEDAEEHEEGICCFAVPIFAYGGEVVAGMSVSLPIFRYEPEKKAALLDVILTHGRAISAALGHQDYPGQASISQNRAGNE